MKPQTLVLATWILMLCGCASPQSRELEAWTPELTDMETGPCKGSPACAWKPSADPSRVPLNAIPADLERHLSAAELASIQDRSITAYKITGWLCRRGCVSYAEPDTELGCNGPDSYVIVNFKPGGHYVIATISADFLETERNYTVIEAHGEEVIASFNSGSVVRIIPNSFEIGWHKDLARCFKGLVYPGRQGAMVLDWWWYADGKHIRSCDQSFYTTKADYDTMPHGPRTLLSNPEYIHKVVMWGDGPDCRDDLWTGFYIHFKSLYALVRN